MKTWILLLCGGVLVAAGAGCDGGGTTGSGGHGGHEHGGGGSTNDGGGGSTSDGGGGAAPALSCGDYCTNVAANCTADDEQYPSEASCLAICATFAEGEKGATTGNTLGCRDYHGGDPASMAPQVHCIHAGPLGGGDTFCGDVCESFCAINLAVCGTVAYADQMACETACAGFPGLDMVPYNTGAVSGDSLACRMYHLSVAAQSDMDAGIHCPHTQEVSTQCAPN